MSAAVGTSTLDAAALRRRMDQSLPAMLDDIEALVSCESPSGDLSAVAASANVVARVGSAHLGAEPERIVVDGCTHVRWRLGDDSGPRVLLLGHHDTVWPADTLARLPFTVTGGTMRGPGCLDMKAGLVMAFHAVGSIGRAANVTILVTGDEEIGSLASRGLIAAEARASSAALVLESTADPRELKVARKGAATYRVRIRGRAAHAGLAHGEGISATAELAHQILAIEAISDVTAATTVSPTLASSGTTTNTIPADAECFVDVRAWTGAEQARVDAALTSLRPCLDGARLEVTGRPARPPMSAQVSQELLARARHAADRLGLEPLRGAAVGGASDANLTAATGLPTIDGLGAVGTGAHADDEHVLLRHIPGRTALLTLLMRDILDAAAGPMTP